MAARVSRARIARLEPEAHYGLGCALANQRRLPEAAEEFRAASGQGVRHVGERLIKKERKAGVSGA